MPPVHPPSTREHTTNAVALANDATLGGCPATDTLLRTVAERDSG